jgi:hypothetical protein
MASDVTTTRQTNAPTRQRGTCPLVLGDRREPMLGRGNASASPNECRSRGLGRSDPIRSSRGARCAGPRGRSGRAPSPTRAPTSRWPRTAPNLRPTKQKLRPRGVVHEDKISWPTRGPNVDWTLGSTMLCSVTGQPLLSDGRLRVRGGGGMTHNHAGGLGLALNPTCLSPTASLDWPVI